MELMHIDAFRRYYNTHIYPELRRTERLRKRLLGLIFFSSLIIFLILTISAYLGVVLLSLFLILPITFESFTSVTAFSVSVRSSSPVSLA